MPLRVGWWALALAVSLLVLGAPAARVHLRSERELPGLSALLAGPRDYHIDAQADIEDAADSAPALEYPLPTLDGVHLLTLKPAAKMQAPSAKVAPEPRFTPDWAGHKGADFSDGASAALGEDVPSANDADASLRADQRSLERSYDSNFHNGFYKAEKEIFMLGRLTPKKHDPEYLNRLSDVFAKPKAVGNISPVGVRAIEPVHFEGGINVPSKRLPMHHSFSTRNPAADTASSFAGAAQGSHPSSAYPSGLPSAASRSSPGAPSSAGPSSAAESSASRILDVVKDVNPYNLFGSSPTSSWADRIASEQTRAAPRPSRPSRASTSTSRSRMVSPATARALPVHVSIVPMPRGQLIARNKRLLDVFHPPKPKPRVPLFRPRARRSSSSSQSEEEIDWHDTAITSKFGKDPLYDSSMRQAMREYKEDLIRAQATLPLQRGEELSDPREQARQQQEQLDYRRLEAEDLQRQRDEQQLLNAGAHNDSDTEPDHLFSQSEQLPVNQRTRSLEATAIPRSESAESRAFPASASSSGAPRPSAAPAASSAPTPSRKSVLPSLGDYSALIRGAKTNPSGRFDDPAAPFTGSNLKRIVGGLGVPSAGALESQYAGGAGGADSAMTGVLGVVGQQLAGMGIPNILAAPTSSVPSIGNPVPNAHAAMQPGWQPGLDTESLSRLGMLGPRSSDREFDHSFGGVVDSLINGLATMYANNGVDLQQAAQATAAAAQGLPTPVAPNQYELGNRAAPASNPYFTSRPQFVDQQGRPLYLSPQHVQQLQAQMAPGERLSDYALPSNYQSNSSPGAFRR